MRRCGDLAAILREIRNLSRGKRGGEKYRPCGVPKRSSERRLAAHAYPGGSLPRITHRKPLYEASPRKRRSVFFRWIVSVNMVLSRFSDVTLIQYSEKGDVEDLFLLALLAGALIDGGVGGKRDISERETRIN